MPRDKGPLTVLALLLLAVLACSPCSLVAPSAPPQETLPTITISSVAARRLEARLREQLQENPDPQFILRITNEEITSLVNEKVSEAEEPPIQEPRIWFTRGRIYVAGRLVNIVPTPTDALLVASVKVVDGQVRLQFDDASVGAVKVPKVVLNELEQTANDALATAQINLTITEVRVREGEIVIAGRK
ncbi:MAG: hypothetical protein H5T59_02345 [Anaerolineae bacterium]|nr:hypothetical protein [Anaerolineae bacterium]